MPISNKIIDKIEELDEGNKEKDLILLLLEMEDEGKRNYKQKYEEEIDYYLSLANKKGGK